MSFFSQQFEAVTYQTHQVMYYNPGTSVPGLSSSPTCSSRPGHDFRPHRINSYDLRHLYIPLSSPKKEKVKVATVLLYYSY